MSIRIKRVWTNEQDTPLDPSDVYKDGHLRLAARLLLDSLAMAAEGDETEIEWLVEWGPLYCAALDLPSERLDELIQEFMTLPPIIIDDDTRMRKATGPMITKLIRDRTKQAQYGAGQG